MAPGSPHPPRPGGGGGSFLVVVAVEGGRRCPEDGPHEADLSKRPREAGPASGPREADLATSSGGRRGL